MHASIIINALSSSRENPGLFDRTNALSHNKITLRRKHTVCTRRSSIWLLRAYCLHLVLLNMTIENVFTTRLVLTHHYKYHTYLKFIMHYAAAQRKNNSDHNKYRNLRSLLLVSNCYVHIHLWNWMT